MHICEKNRTAFFAMAIVLMGSASCANGGPESQSPVPPEGTTTLATAAPQVQPSNKDWFQFRGPKADGYAPDTNINKAWGTKPPKLVWQTEMTDNGYAGPAVSQGMVFIVNHSGSDDIVRAIGLTTGKDVWTYTYPDASNDNYGYSRSTPTISNGNVYVISRLGKVHCLEAKTGKLVWMRDLIAEFSGRRPTWEMAMSPFIDGNKLIVCPGGPGASVVALDPKTGKTIWQGGGDEAPGYATPVVATLAGKRQYLIFNAKALVGVDASNGNVLWQQPWITANDVNAATPLVIGNSVFITTGYNRGCALVDVTAQGASIRWENKAIKAHFSSPVLKGDKIYGTGDPGELVCLNVADGAIQWRERGFEKGGICAVDGTIIAMNGSNGDVIQVALDPTSYKELGRFNPLGGQSWTAPIVSNGYLIVRNKNALACLDLR